MSEVYLYPLAVLLGVLAGVINTLAGSGSLITLPLFIFLFGLPPSTANGTNRIGVMMQTFVGLRTMRKRATIPLRPSLDIIISVLLGALIGARLALNVSEYWMNFAIGVLMVFMLGVILVKPEKWLRSRMAESNEKRGPLQWGLFFIIGLYGGFIQAGVGIFLLASMVLGAGYPLLRANAVKLLIVGVYSIPVIGIFMSENKVVWGIGLLVAVGQMIGAWFAARFATGHPKAEIWIRRLLILIVVASILKFFGVYSWIWRLFSQSGL